jgi:glycosyltransferase involved in cell wall biosynthesis
MKIAFLAHSLFPTAEPFAGGLEKIVHLLCSELTALGHEIYLYGHPESKGDFHLIPFTTLNIDDLYISTSITSEEEDFQNKIYQAAINDIQQKDFDIIHNHSLNAAAIALGNTVNTPFITTCHTPPFATLRQGVKSLDGRINQTFTMVSHSLGMEWSSIVSRYRVIHNGVDVNKWDFEEKANSNNAFWCGRMCKEKAPHEAILAAKKSGIKLRLAGPISDENYFKEQVQPLLTEHIEYIGHLTQAELNKEMGHASLLYFTSVWDEPYGLVLAEALSCGTPIIGYRSGAAPEIVTPECGTLVEVGHWKELAKATPSAQKISRKACRSRAVNFCSSKKMAYGYQALYNQLKKTNNLLNPIAI